MKYAKTDMPLPDSDDLTVLNRAAIGWCAEVNDTVHSETCQVPAEQLVIEQPLLRELPMLRARIGKVEVRKVDKLSTVRASSARYSVPSMLVAAIVEVVTYDGQVRIYGPAGDVVAVHPQMGPGEASILDEHYPTPRKAPGRGPRARTEAEKTFLALGETATTFVQAGAAAGVTTLPKEIIEIVAEILPAHDEAAVIRAIARATKFGRFRAADIRSILAIGPAGQDPVPAGENVIVALPTSEVRSLDAYRIENLA